MRYLVHNLKTGDYIPFYDEDELKEFFEDKEQSDYDVTQEFACKGCEEYKPDTQERHDFHGITTGYYCEDCYENNYPYRKDSYPTIETHGYGERLNDDY